MIRFDNLIFVPDRSLFLSLGPCNAGLRSYQLNIQAVEYNKFVFNWHSKLRANPLPIPQPTDIIHRNHSGRVCPRGVHLQATRSFACHYMDASPSQYDRASSSTSPPGIAELELPGTLSNNSIVCLSPIPKTPCHSHSLTDRPRDEISRPLVEQSRLPRDSSSGHSGTLEIQVITRAPWATSRNSSQSDRRSRNECCLSTIALQLN